MDGEPITTEKENSQGSNTNVLKEDHVNDEQQQGQSKPGSKLQIIKGTEEEGASQEEKGQEQEKGSKEHNDQEVKEENDQEVKKENDQEVKEENDQELKEENDQEVEGENDQKVREENDQEVKEENDQEVKEENVQEVKEENDQEVKEENDQEEKEENDEEVKEEKQEEAAQENVEEEEAGYVEDSEPDPAAPLNLSDSQEALKPRFELKPEQMAEIEQLWDEFQNYTPAYSDINGYITEKELVYLLKSLLLMTYTTEQFQELVTFCVRPPHPQGHITFDQFVKIATIRQRDFPVEEELRSALKVLDTGNEGLIDREYMKEVLLKQGYKMLPKELNKLIKEVDIANDGTIGVEDVVGTMCIDLTLDDTFIKKEEDDEEENPNP